MNLEMLLMVLAVVLAAVFNVILPWVRKRQEDARADNAEPELQEAPTPVLAYVPSASPALAPEFETRRNVPIRTRAPMAPAATRPARRSPVGSLPGMRDGIVLAAVLGPCRAQTPFD